MSESLKRIIELVKSVDFNKTIESGGICTYEITLKLKEKQRRIQEALNLIE